MAFVVAVIWVASTGETKAVAAAVAKLIPPSQAEFGNLLYLAHRDPNDDRVFYFYEQYRDAAAYQSHIASTHFNRYALEDAIPRLERRERAFYATWDA